MKPQTVTLSDKEWKALLYFLDQHSECQANAGCNDLPREVEEMFTKREGTEMASEYAAYNNPNNPDDPDDNPSWPLPDSCLLALIDQKIRKQVS